jgi:hypothetical protein
MRDHTLSLPDEVLRMVLAWYRHDKDIEYRHHEALPMLTVCRRWNVRQLVTGRGHPIYQFISPIKVVSTPILYHDLDVDTGPLRRDFAVLVASLQGSTARGQDWSALVRNLSITIENEDQAQKEDLYFLLSRLQSLHRITGYNTSHILQVCAGACASSLHELDITYSDISDYTFIGAFHQLRSLTIAHDYEPDNYAHFTSMAPWQLPLLEELAWEELNVTSGPLGVICFLDRCQFSHLRCLDLETPVSTEDGPHLLITFLAAHPHIASLGVPISPEAYSRILPFATASHLNLVAAVRIDPGIVNHLSASVHRLDLPFFDYDRDLDLSPEVLSRLLAHPKKIQQIKLQCDLRWSQWAFLKDCVSRESLELVCVNAFRSHEHRETAMIYLHALRLWDQGITVSDENGLAFHKHWDGLLTGIDEIQSTGSSLSSPS